MFMPFKAPVYIACSSQGFNLIVHHLFLVYVAYTSFSLFFNMLVYKKDLAILYLCKIDFYCCVLCQVVILSYESGFFQAWVTLGRAQLNFGEPDSAIESFDRALAVKVHIESLSILNSLTVLLLFLFPLMVIFLKPDPFLFWGELLPLTFCSTG